VLSSISFSTVSISVPSSLLVSTVSSTLLSSISNALCSVVASEPYITEYLSYVELLLAAYPSVQCAEKTLEQDIRSHAHTVSLIEDALSSPSSVQEPSYVEKLENEYPSIVTAYQEVYDVETDHSQFAYVQPLLSSLEEVHQTILTDISLLQQQSSPSTVEAEKVVYTALVDSPSVVTDLHTVAELAAAYPSLSYAEKVIAYYEEVEPSVVATVSEVVFSPAEAHSPLPAEYPTLAEADETIVYYEKVVPSPVLQMCEEAVESPASVPAREDSYVKDLESRYKGLFSAERVAWSYKKSDASVANQVLEIEASPEVLHEPAVVANPELANAISIVHSYSKVVPAQVIEEVSEFELNPAALASASRAAAKAAAVKYASLASAYRKIAQYKKVNAAVVQKVSEEMSCSMAEHAHASVQKHAALASAFKEVNAVAQKFPVLVRAQESVDCAESSEADLFSAYQHVSYARHSAHQYIKHSASFKKNSFHQVVHHG